MPRKALILGRWRYYIHVIDNKEYVNVKSEFVLLASLNNAPNVVSKPVNKQLPKHSKIDQRKFLAEMNKLENVLRTNNESKDIDKFNHLYNLCEAYRKQHQKQSRREVVMNAIHATTTYGISDIDTPVKDLSKRAVQEKKPWILLHPNAGLFNDSYPIPRYAVMNPNATPEDVLNKIVSMTIRRGRHAIADHIYFEGITKLHSGMWVVNTDS